MSRSVRGFCHVRTVLYAVAAVTVLAVVAVGLIGWSDGDRVPATAPSTPARDSASVILPPPDSAGLADGQLFAALEDRRWVGLERFDVPSPTALTAEVTFDADGSAGRLTAHDGCHAYAGTVEFNGSTIVTDGFDHERVQCRVDVLQLGAGQQVDLLAGATTFMLRDVDGSPLARFTDYDALDAATVDDLAGALVVDGVQPVTFVPSGRMELACGDYSWEARDERIIVSVDGPEPACDSHVADGPARSSVLIALRDIAQAGAEVRSTPAGVLIAGDRGAVHLQTLEPAAIDPNGITIAAGAAFGLEPGLGVTPGAVLTAVEPHLGVPDRDTGWLADIDDGTTFTCGLSDYREISWGDLTFGFWGSGARTLLLFWRVGDERIVGNRLPDVDRAPARPRDIRTEHGVTVGDGIGAIPDGNNISHTPFGDVDGRIGSDDVMRVGVASPDPAPPAGSVGSSLRGGSYLVIDGTVAAFGREAFNC